jgi:hypothetical protein
MAKDSAFCDLYINTCCRIINVVAEVGCGTGGVIGPLDELKAPRLVLISILTFISHCSETFKSSATSSDEFHVADAMKLDAWWKSMGYDKKHKAPLMVCPKNTIMIMP